MWTDRHDEGNIHFPHFCEGAYKPEKCLTLLHDLQHIYETKNTYNVRVGKTEGKRPLVISRCRRVDDTEVYLKDVKDGIVLAKFMLLRIGTSGELL